ncbi:hydrogenase expression/formation protein HypE [Neomoorella thermoacetica]|uniref:hydrogenase expression/formation protein HypE n=1 Tax=Neomoorella thermoacetica TaxID=1525 RepID=UPI0008FA361F|nr:hydrogenase expression/formation protein HypE [Moorella thermoacetica]OIQ12652.1 hydrogenase isoenzymes formation protein HypE [Moorella thermoacetica]
MQELTRDKILLAHGDGGLLTHELISNFFLRHFENPILKTLSDAATLPLEIGKGRLVVTTDSFVIKPVFFPGGDIGKLAVCGTVNDLAVSGAVPHYLTVSFILEEGLPLADLEKILTSMAEAARMAGVTIVAGDTKVVERGNADKIFINTTGVGLVPDGVELGYHKVEEGDVVIINGNIGEHGLAVVSRREGLEFESDIISDCTCLNSITQDLLFKYKGIKLMRDPTRGGVATTVKEIALATNKDIFLFEDRLPISDGVRWAAEMLGLDPLYLANEGKFIAVVLRQEAPDIIAALRRLPQGQQASIIGEVKNGQGNVFLKTSLGATKLIDMLAGEQLPRIC